jgi:adenylylsulfate kinase
MEFMAKKMTSTKEPKSKNITWHLGTINRGDRSTLLGQKSALLWFTGLSGSGKSTLAQSIESALVSRGIYAYVLDGDNVRFGLNKDLGFSPEDRTENIRRIGEVAKLFVDAGAVVLTAFISPYREDRDRVRENQASSEDFIEVFVDCPLEICEERDPKGLYKKARSGEIPQFTGISAPYEEPVSPELSIKTGDYSIEECTQQTIDFLIARGVISE